MNIEQTLIRGKTTRVYHSAEGLDELIVPFAAQISDSTTESRFTKSLTKEQVEQLITLNMFTLIVDADSKKLLAHASITPTIRRKKPASLIGAWGSNEQGFGPIVMELAAARAQDKPIAMVHIFNRGAKRAMKKMGARKIGLERSKATGNFVFVYDVTPALKRRSL